MTAHVPRLTGLRALAVLADVAAASVAAGPILRRKPVVKVLEKLRADRRSVRRIQALRAEFGSRPVELAILGRRLLIVTDPNDAGRVLAESPQPFHPANLEKRKALQQFQPHGVLISPSPPRDERRAMNEAALDTAAPLHRLAGPMADAIAEEARALAAAVVKTGRLRSADFETTWWRVVRRVVLGRAAADDSAVTDRLRRLRSSANWSFASLPHPRKRREFLDDLHRYAQAPDPDSLMGALMAAPARPGVDPVGQVPQWLFAFDAAGMATIRAMALLATHPVERARALADVGDLEGPGLHPYLRACVLESVRLWPTTPALLRDTTSETEWGSGANRSLAGAGAGLLITVPAFHRDGSLLPFADRFTPEIWLDGRAQSHPQLVPFSAGPVECPGRNLVLFTTSTMLAHLLSTIRVTLRSTPTLSPDRPLPVTLDQYGLEFEARSATSRAAAGAER